MNERLQQIQGMIERAADYGMSPADEALLDICTALFNEVARLNGLEVQNERADLVIGID